MNSKTLIIAGIAIVLLVLGGIVLTQHNTHTQENTTSYLVGLKSADLGYIQIDTPENSKFEVKNKVNETDKGMVYLKNTGAYSKEIEGIIINKNLTDQLIPETMQLDSQNDTIKVFKSNNAVRMVKTIDDTDIILVGSDQHVLSEMAQTIIVKDTKNITSPKPVEKTQVEKVIDKNKEIKKQTTNKEKPKAETTKDKNKEIKKQTTNKGKPKVETTKDKKPDVETTVDKTPKVETTKDTPTDPLYIGGGIFKTGSELEDKTEAKIYIDGAHPGDTIKIKIKYYRDGESLNTGNLVTATVDDEGYVHISSADAYTKFPDKAYMELYDASGILQSTQTVTLTPDSTTQYF